MSIPLDRYLRRGAEIMEECAALDREIARLEARKAARLAERVELLLGVVRPGETGFDQAERSMICEVSAGLRVTQFAAAKALANAHTLHDRLPAARAAFEVGEISSSHVDVIVAAARDIPVADVSAIAAFEAQVVPYAAAETRARTKAFAECVVAAVAPAPVAERHRRAQDERTVSVTDEGAGMSALHLTGPSVLVHAAFDLATQEGRAILTAAKQAGPDESGASDERRLDQVRFDRIMLRLLTGRVDGDADVVAAIRPIVQVTISASALLGFDERMAELDGHGPLDPATARLFAASASSWERLFLDERGMVTRTSSYQPTESMRRFLRARDRTCRFPGCRQPARRCQIDHNHDHARGGPTEIGNLACFCERHHAIKHPDLDPRWRWTARQGPGGVITWISPAGVEYTDTPPPRVMFVDSRPGSGRAAA
ncbi:HNH endonuclease signature motif containing protein [Microbacterium sp. ASV81]|uniref:DUF222 domain-containing protein n=1 Tax=Microbacterium capsulatum TaxID=3041921 RepID=A0ABU0XL62_9MICO|nr:DUF222 domain-containing protein [Microbacterium sp. ASV81]MDQ4215864.1 DUF222 domain-containing protein [Microbacterium sp. ASV81]